MYLTVYARALGYGFFDDDFYQEAVTWRTLGMAIRADPQFRPLFWVLFPATGSVFGKTPFAHHLVNHLLHLANCGLAIVVLRPRIGAGRAGVTVLAWNLLPQLAFPLGWIAQRNDPLMTLWLLVAMALHDRARRKLAWLAVAAAFLSKVTALAFPLAFTHRAGLRRFSGDARAGWALFAISLAIAALAAHDDPLKAHLGGLALPALALNAVKNVAVGVASWFVPVPFLSGPLAIAGWTVCLAATGWLLARHGQRDAAAGSLAVVAVLLALPFAKNAELRISYAASLFALAALIGAIRPRSGTPGVRIATMTALAGLALYGIPAGIRTVSGFASSVRDVGAAPPFQDAYCVYPVAFYPWLRSQEARIARQIGLPVPDDGSHGLPACPDQQEGGAAPIGTAPL